MKLQLFKERAQSERTRDLKKVLLFAGLSRREIGVVQGFMHERHFLRDEVVFDEGEKGEAFYIVLKGAVLVCHQGQPDKPIATLDAGKFFGELALLDDAPRSAQVRAADECTLLVLFRGDFLGLMQSHGLIASKIAIELARQLGARLRTSSVGPTSNP